MRKIFICVLMFQSIFIKFLFDSCLHLKYCTELICNSILCSYFLFDWVLFSIKSQCVTYKFQLAKRISMIFRIFSTCNSYTKLFWYSFFLFTRYARDQVDKHNVIVYDLKSIDGMFIVMKMLFVLDLTAKTKTN